MRSHVTVHIRIAACKKDKILENIILNCGWKGYAAHKAYEYARIVLKKRWKRAEDAILKNSYSSYMYARHVIGGRWRKAEKVICNDPASAYLYAKYVLKNRFIQAENKKNWHHSPRHIYLYSKYILKSRWKDKENSMLNASRYSASSLAEYAVHVIKGRWPEAELVISDSAYIKKYATILKDSEKEEFHNIVLMKAMIENKYWNYAREYIECLNKPERMSHQV